MKVGIIIGSKSDMALAQEVEKYLLDLGIQGEIHVASAHRNPQKVKDLANQDYALFIAIAGLSAALPGALASHTTKPIIGVPATSKYTTAGGLDSILSIVQMPPGIPVATVGLNSTKNAAYLAASILSLSDKTIKENLKKKREEMK